MTSPRRSQILSAITTFHPTAAQLEQIATTHTEPIDRLIVDNSAEPQASRNVQNFCESRGYTLIQNEQNNGVAVAINQAARWAEARGYEYLATFDQDSRPYSDVIQTLHAVARKAAGQRVAIIGSNIKHSSSGRYTARAVSDREDDYIAADVVVISGALLPVQTFLQLGGFREDFFMDLVDIEYCWRAQKAGYAVLQALKPGLIHGAGHAIRRRILGMDFWTLNHQPYRYYHMARNSMLLNIDYPQKASLRNFCLWLARIVILEPQPFLKLKLATLGALDGWRLAHRQQS